MYTIHTMENNNSADHTHKIEYYLHKFLLCSNTAVKYVIIILGTLSYNGTEPPYFSGKSFYGILSGKDNR